MTATLIALNDGCPHCGTPLVAGSLTGFCQDGYWQDQRRRYVAGGVVSVVAESMLRRNVIDANGRVVKSVGAA